MCTLSQIPGQITRSTRAFVLSGAGRKWYFKKGLLNVYRSWNIVSHWKGILRTFSNSHWKCYEHKPEHVQCRRTLCCTRIDSTRLDSTNEMWRKNRLLYCHGDKNYMQYSPLGSVLPLYRTGVSLLSREQFLYI